MRFIPFFLILPMFLLSQNNEEVGRKGQLLFNLGTEYRITPIYKNYSASFSDGTYFTNLDKQNSGFSGNIGFEVFIFKNISFDFMGSLRYDLLVYEPPTNIYDFSQTIAERRWMPEYHLNLSYYFKPFRNGRAFIGLGISLLNRNSNYKTEEIFFDSEGNIINSETVSGDYMYNPSRLSLGYKFRKNKVIIGVYLSRKSPYFKEPTTLIIPHVGYKFDFAEMGLFKK